MVNSTQHIMNEEMYRLFTYTKFPRTAATWPSKLAKCGFYYTGSGDIVKCYRCGLTLMDWRPDDDPLERHQRTNPDCPVATNTDNLNAAMQILPAELLHILADRPVSSLEADDVRRIVPPVNRSCPDELSLQRLRKNAVRKRTFHDWPKEGIVAGSSLARAGFFYTGFDDKVRCSFCKREFVDWRPGDIPTEEHRRELPGCPFVLQNFCFPTQLAASSSVTASGHQPQATNQV